MGSEPGCTSRHVDTNLSPPYRDIPPHSYPLILNSQDGWKITDFVHRDGDSEIDGRTFYVNSNVPEDFRPHPQLFRDHFRQCVLANLKAAPAEPQPDRIYDPEIDLYNGGFNLSNEFWNSAEGKAQLDVEIRSRLEKVITQRALEASNE